MSCLGLPVVKMTAGDYLEIGVRWDSGTADNDLTGWAERKLYISQLSGVTDPVIYELIDVDFTQGEGVFKILRGDLVVEGSHLAEIKLGQILSTTSTAEKFIIEISGSIGPSS